MHVYHMGIATYLKQSHVLHMGIFTLLNQDLYDPISETAMHGGRNFTCSYTLAIACKLEFK